MDKIVVHCRVYDGVFTVFQRFLKGLLYLYWLWSVENIWFVMLESAYRIVKICFAANFVNITLGSEESVNIDSVINNEVLSTIDATLTMSS